MTEKEKNETNPTEKRTERIFVLGIGRGPKMRTLEFVFTPKEEDTKTEGSEAEKPVEEKEGTKQDS